MKHKTILFFAFILLNCSNNSNKIYVLFDNIETLDENSNVTCNGIKVGKISNIDLFGNQVIVELSINNKYPIPKESIFLIKQDGLLGNGHIDIEINLKNNQKIKCNDTLKGINNNISSSDKLIRILKKDSINNNLQQ
jgi:ABC-type transporter Mla subunit MlaD